LKPERTAGSSLLVALPYSPKCRPHHYHRDALRAGHGDGLAVAKLSMTGSANWSRAAYFHVLFPLESERTAVRRFARAPAVTEVLERDRAGPTSRSGTGGATLDQRSPQQARSSLHLGVGLEAEAVKEGADAFGSNRIMWAASEPTLATPGIRGPAL
jgi:hypothetical protein